jgi:carboxylesterase
VPFGSRSPAIWNTPTDAETIKPFRFRGGERGCLLLHGFAGTPPEMRELGEFLAANGYDAMGPLLDGHGQTPEAMAQTRWTDWARSAQHALDRLRADHQQVFVAGQSLGGTLALHLAANNPDLAGIIPMAAMGSRRFFRDWRLRVIRTLKYVVRWHTPARDSDLGDPLRLQALHSYARRPSVCIESLMQFIRVVERELPSIRVPTLLLHGRRDRTVPVENAPFILERLGSADKQLVWFERSGHTVTIDLERDLVNRTVLRWLQSH